MSLSYPTVNVTGSAWVNLAAASPGIANVDAFIQNTGQNNLMFYFSASGTAPTETKTNFIKPGEAVQGNAANIWIRGDGQTSCSFFAV